MIYPLKKAITPINLCTFSPANYLAYFYFLLIRNNANELSEKMCQPSHGNSTKDPWSLKLLLNQFDTELIDRQTCRLIRNLSYVELTQEGA